MLKVFIKKKSIKQSLQIYSSFKLDISNTKVADKVADLRYRQNIPIKPHIKLLFKIRLSKNCEKESRRNVTLFTLRILLTLTLIIYILN